MTTGLVNGIFQQQTDASSAAQLVRYDQITSLAGPSIIYKFTSGSIDVTAMASTVIFTTPNDGTTFIPTYIVGYCTAANTATIEAQVSFGTNGAAYDNILAISQLTDVLAAGLYVFEPIANATAVPANTAVRVNVTTGATAVSQAVTFYVFGYFI